MTPRVTKRTAQVVLLPSNSLAAGLFPLLHRLDYSVLLHASIADVQTEIGGQADPGILVLGLDVLASSDPTELFDAVQRCEGPVLAAIPGADLSSDLQSVALLEIPRGAATAGILRALVTWAIEEPAAVQPNLARSMRQLDQLTARERQVLDLLMEGRSLKGIGRALGISHKTVQVHRGSIFRKAGVDSVVGLMRHLLDRGLPLAEKAAPASEAPRERSPKRTKARQ